jgi:predicted MPP superfamily phosphohydrolase
MNEFTKLFVIAGILFVLFGTVSSYCLTVSHYELRVPEIQTSVRLLLITDLHSCLYGKNQAKLIQAIEAEAPDALMFCGDIADDKLPIENLNGLLEAVGTKYPCFYVTGNHEYWSGEVESIKRFFRAYGVIVLGGEYRSLRVRGEEITVCGVDDPESRNFESQLTAAAHGVKAGTYAVLLSHRPELFPSYAARNFDLVLAGHAHGGLWRIPWILNGAVAPNQGFFPKYTSGQYREQSTTMIVSRGLARESTRIPRFFNRVELVTVDLFPLETADSAPSEKTLK